MSTSRNRDANRGVATSSPQPLAESSSNAVPEWAGQIIDLLTKLVNKAEEKRPPSWAEMANALPEFPIETRQSPPVKPKPILAKPNKAVPTPKLGESGSGYTRISNGRLIRNKRPAPRTLVQRQARNWRSNATKELVSFLKEKGIGPEDPKPVNDLAYTKLVNDLESSKAYQAYINNVDEPLEVQAWRREKAAKVSIDTTTPQCVEAQKELSPVNRTPAKRDASIEAPKGDFPIARARSRSRSVSRVRPQNGQGQLSKPSRKGEVLHREGTGVNRV